MDLLHDLLVYPSGPRARDKLSHGEADYKSVSASLPKVIVIILAWLGRESVVEKEFRQKLEKCMGSYSSRFHPVSMLQQKVINLAYESPKLNDQITLTPSLEPWFVLLFIFCSTYV
ncbi:endoplasmic reticulum membrane-associated RNA degradation protein-like [Elysia marginata]|uniref:Endoplasmic reticulum membrane-associated RNA degradation protein-like n=1 Tax=Elysia marginata TaxID=1093978 RepID=A0AAV4GGM3_9GAST|nr:endoplasmic reticulum membrane-associated RNA degradation protein-like [Elysia marginata]